MTINVPVRSTINVLVLCTGNSARSVLAECLINRLGQGRWQAFSAGSHPTGQVNPLTIEVLGEKGFDVTGLRSKSWDEFAAPGAPKMDLVVTVCDNAAGEVCPSLARSSVQGASGFSRSGGGHRQPRRASGGVPPGLRHD